MCVLVDPKHDIKFGYLILYVPSMFLHIFILWLASFQFSPLSKHISGHSWDSAIDPAGHWSGRPAPQQWRRHPPRCPNAFRRWTSGGPTAGPTEATPPGNEWRNPWAKSLDEWGMLQIGGGLVEVKIWEPRFGQQEVKDGKISNSFCPHIRPINRAHNRIQ